MCLNCSPLSLVRGSGKAPGMRGLSDLNARIVIERNKMPKYIVEATITKTYDIPEVEAIDEDDAISKFDDYISDDFDEQFEFDAVWQFNAREV